MNLIYSTAILQKNQIHLFSSNSFYVKKQIWRMQSTRVYLVFYYDISFFPLAKIYLIKNWSSMEIVSFHSILRFDREWE